MARTVINRWGYKIRIGDNVQVIQARGGVVSGIVDKLEVIGIYAREYGPRVILETGESASVNDVIVIDPARVAINPIKGINTRRRSAAITRRKSQFDTLPPRFENVSCSQCGGDFGPGNYGYSSCQDHTDLMLIREHAKALSSRKKDTRDMQERFLTSRGLTVEKAKRLPKAGRDKLTRYYKTWLAMQ